MTEVATPQAPIDAPETIEVENLDQFVKILAAWHSEKVLACKHLLTVPEGSVFEIDEVPIDLSGNAHKAFKLGVEMALMQLGELPFVAELEDEAAPVAAG